MAANLLKIGELADFHAVAPDFPAEAPCAQSRAFPVILDKADVVQRRVKADGNERAQIQLLQVGRRGFDDDLILIVVLQPVGVLAIAAIGRAARGLHIGGGPGLGAQGAQGGGRMEGARANLHVIGLQDGAALTGPIAHQAQDDLLKAAGGGWKGGTGGHRIPLGRARQRRRHRRLLHRIKAEQGQCCVAAAQIAMHRADAMARGASGPQQGYVCPKWPGACLFRGWDTGR